MPAKSFADSTLLPQPQQQRREWRRPLVFGLLLFLVWTWKLNEWFHSRGAILHSGGEQDSSVYTDWDDVPTSEKLRWVRCAIAGFPSTPEYLCARLTVPMDYQRPLNQSADNPKVHIAMVLLPAPGHGLDTGRFSESPLLVNPGGPGGAGTLFVQPPIGPTVQTAAGGDVDLIGFDPRGIGHTVPRADCFTRTEGSEDPSKEAKTVGAMNRLAWMATAHDVGLPNGTNEALDALAHRARAVSKLCKLKDNDESGFRYMATPNVAADMKSIIDAHEVWLEESGFETVTLGARLRSPSETAPPSTKGKLVYWGFSYGTLLGQTFAAMYPDSVGRLILDGVVNSHTYDRPTWWVSTMRDSDAVLDKFFYYCHLAKEACPLHRDGDEGPSDVMERYQHVMRTLRAQPLLTVSDITNTPVMLLEADLKKAMFVGLYSPVKLFPLMAMIFDKLYAGCDLGSFDGVGAWPMLMCHNNLGFPYFPEESQPAIGCSDQQVKRNATLEELYKETSKYTSFADVLISLMISCEGWDIEAKFPRPDWDANFQSPDPVNTSFPILFAGNTHDNVTPLKAAVDMSQNFVNAGVFELEAEGHTTMATVSACAVKKIHDYLHKGIVPPHPAIAADGTLSGWDKCQPDEQPWKPFGSRADMQAEQVRTLQAFKDVHAEIVRRLAPPTKFRLFDY
ncbi:hypothetical protein CSOJ01_09630 [Colletotrichum sojae]|uniref:Peptidase S33 tripeptidyl aminopeptidase-like C-terminal domain-containing protein n=1 Tax=Colletotrichum sojae TaxID=2175907 RepID=A0A8H6J2H0_9PEZI|nr:hypothetical protein CSOJ01_09630 [Colletotrichum sojae]